MNGTAHNPEGDLAADNAKLARQLAQFEQRQRCPEEDLIAAKMRCGLSRQEAQAIIERQREFEAAKAAARAARIETLKTVLSGRETLSEAMEKTKRAFSADLHHTVLRAEITEVLSLLKESAAKLQS